MNSVVKLNINNRDFSIACGVGQEDALINLSYELDRRIKENAVTLGDTNTNLLLVITALQLLDEVTDIKNSFRNGLNPQGLNLSAELAQANAETISQITARVEELASKIMLKSA